MSREHLKNRLGRLKNARARSVLFSGALTLAVIAVIVLINILFTSLEDRFALSADFSYNSLTVQSKTTEAILKALEKDVDIYFLTAGRSDTVGDTNILRSDLRVILNRYRARSGHIRVTEDDLVSNPSLSARFAESLNNRELSGDCLIVQCAANGRAALLLPEDLVRYGYDLDADSYVPIGFMTEKALTEAIVNVTADQVPLVRLLRGHGELSAAEASVLTGHMADLGYQTEDVTLHSADDLDPDVPLIILCPQFDISGDELTLLTGFADRGGSILYISRYTDDRETPNLELLMYYFGIRQKKGVVIADGTQQGSYYADTPLILFPYVQVMPETQEMIGAARDLLLMPGARAFEIIAERDQSIYAAALLKSGSAYLHEITDGEETPAKRDTDETGVFDLCVLSRRYLEDDSFGTFIAVGNAEMFVNDWIYETTYQEDFLNALLRALGKQRPTQLDIAYRTDVRPSLTLRSLALPAALSFALPFIVALAGAFILYRRRDL